ncbi:MAG: porin family protein [Acidimicrobiia bacterium]|nr:porin family protein [Acidimicrobiia bacterium]
MYGLIHMPRMPACAVLACCLTTTNAAAQDGSWLFVGAVAGLSTLSADARSVTSSDSVAISLYKPENGPALNVLVGAHLTDYITIQANYIWNRNDLALVAAQVSDSGPSFYEQPQDSSQHAVVGDLLVYFRERRSRVRPYLSFGGGIVRLETRVDAAVRIRGAVLPPPGFAATRTTLRVAVGMDITLAGTWSFRYSFSESLSRNPISAHLSPRGQRNLANFQNLFGIVRAL